MDVLQSPTQNFAHVAMKNWHNCVFHAVSHAKKKRRSLWLQVYSGWPSNTYTIFMHMTNQWMIACFTCRKETCSCLERDCWIYSRSTFGACGNQNLQKVACLTCPEKREPRDLTILEILQIKIFAKVTVNISTTFHLCIVQLRP